MLKKYLISVLMISTTFLNSALILVEHDLKSIKHPLKVFFKLPTSKNWQQVAIAGYTKKKQLIFKEISKYEWGALEVTGIRLVDAYTNDVLFNSERKSNLDYFYWTAKGETILLHGGFYLRPKQQVEIRITSDNSKIKTALQDKDTEKKINKLKLDVNMTGKNQGENKYGYHIEVKPNRNNYWDFFVPVKKQELD